MYSVGKTLLELLVGCAPSANLAATERAVGCVNACLCVPTAQRRQIRKPAELSLEARGLIVALTQKEASNRPSASQALKAKFLQQRRDRT
jgi:hypothetical protein